MTNRLTPYAPDWRSTIAPACRERAGHRCERCGVPGSVSHHRVFAFWEMVYGIVDDARWTTAGTMKAANVVRRRMMIGLSKVDAVSISFTDPVEVVLHSHHRDGDKSNDEPGNHECLCPRCHHHSHSMPIGQKG